MGDDVARICVGDAQLGMRGAQVTCDSGGIGGLVKSGLIKPDSEGLHWAFALRLHQRHDGGAIHATGQKCPQRHIRDHLPLYRLAKHLTECRNCIAFVFDLVLCACLNLCVQVPIPADANAAMMPARADRLLRRSGRRRTIDREDGSWFQFVEARMNAARGGYIHKAQILRQCVAAHITRAIWDAPAVP